MIKGLSNMELKTKRVLDNPLLICPLHWLGTLFLKSFKLIFGLTFVPLRKMSLVWSNWKKILLAEEWNGWTERKDEEWNGWTEKKDKDLRKGML